jgi:molybdopterin converting factor small subunit
MIRLQVQYAAQLRALLGAAQEDVELPPGSTLAHLVAQLAAQRAEAGAHLLTSAGTIRPSLLLVVNEAVVPADQAEAKTLCDGDRVALLPPIAGG